MNKHIRDYCHSSKNLVSQIVIDSSYIGTMLAAFIERTGIARHSIYYPLKVNSNIEVIRYLNNAGTGFEIASYGELQQLKKLKIAPDRIIFGNPVKIKEHIRQAVKYGIKLFACDTSSELEKIASTGNGLSVYFRLAVQNSDAQWALQGKFGASEQDVHALFLKAIQLGVRPCGISFHVGWNNTGIGDWLAAMQMCQRVLGSLLSNGLPVSFVNIGGGFPAHRVDQLQHLNQIASTIHPYMKRMQEQGIAVIAEPGSFLLANAGILICKVVDVIERQSTKWLYLNTGIMQGFAWIHAGLQYDIIPLSNTNEKLQPYIVTGATCDSQDVFARNCMLPVTIQEGDYVGITPAGAYISASAQYNGFSFPEEKVL